MKWFQELKSWGAIDSHREPRPGCPDVPHVLHQRLQSVKPRSQFPDDLHQDIMSQVRNSCAVQTRLPERLPLPIWNVARISAAVALLVMIGFAIFSISRRSEGAFEPATRTGDLSVSLRSPVALAELPFSVLSPLEDEWKRVNQDMTNAASILLSSVP